MRSATNAGYKYLTVVVDHDTGRLVWAAPGTGQGHPERVLRRVSASNGARQITHVTADGADWIATVVAGRCENAVRCADSFHVVKWAAEALDVVRP